jgi:hypothetical protein
LNIVEYALKSQLQKLENPGCILLLVARPATHLARHAIVVQVLGLDTACSARRNAWTGTHVDVDFVEKLVSKDI